MEMPSNDPFAHVREILAKGYSVENEDQLERVIKAHPEHADMLKEYAQAHKDEQDQGKGDTIEERWDMHGWGNL
jgi:hypothetical protein